MQVLQSSPHPAHRRPASKMALGYGQSSRPRPNAKAVHIVPCGTARPARCAMSSCRASVCTARKPRAPANAPASLSPISVRTQQKPWALIHHLPGLVPRHPSSAACPLAKSSSSLPKSFGKKTTPSRAAKKKASLPMRCGRSALTANRQVRRGPLLRKAFPEVGSQPTADEMEGKTLDMGPADVVQPAAPAHYPAAEIRQEPARLAQGHRVRQEDGRRPDRHGRNQGRTHRRTEGHAARHQAAAASRRRAGRAPQGTRSPSPMPRWPTS